MRVTEVVVLRKVWATARAVCLTSALSDSKVRRFLARWPERTSATVLRTEAVRALRGSGHAGRIGAARRLFRAMRLIRVYEPLWDRAGDLEPRELGPLDALHLATALAVGTDLVTYDQRLGDARPSVGPRRGIARLRTPCAQPGGRSLRERYLARWRVQ